MSDGNNSPRPLDAGLEQTLRDLGPLMAQQEAAERSAPDPVFVSDLRARLVDGNERSQAVSSAKQRPGRAGRRIYPWAGVAAVVAIAAVLVLAFNLRSAGAPHKPVAVGPPIVSSTFTPPVPGLGDITKSYPLNGGLGGGGLVSPVVSRIDVTYGQPYPGRVTIAPHTLPTLPARVPAYQLQGLPPNLKRRVAALARVLGIRAPITQQSGYLQYAGLPRQVPFVVAAQSGRAVRNTQGVLFQSLRSVALSRFTGALIYHDTTDDATLTATSPPPTRPVAARLARSWLSALGWPSGDMPLVSSETFSGTRQLDFSWAGVPLADTVAAAVQVDSHNRIIEAYLYPPVARVTSVPAPGPAPAWSALRAGRLPIGVKIIDNPNTPGTAELQRIRIEQVLTTSGSGAQYLVPAYRFEGAARIRGVSGTYPWLALAPITGKP